ncbi:hypothetical protein ACFY12_03815 [Streptomyces sp. NPDC001339]|uniref:hypothetical protein n=1 Tax=Streptomyces sp. NPDC001339 TaxID=3364563 RepID=UPI0036C6BEA2
MSTVSRRLDQASAGQLGHGSLDAACADFQEKWKYGMAQISKLASSIRGSVDATAEAYRTCDAGIQQAFSRTPAPSDAHGGTTASAGRASAFG